MRSARTKIVILVVLVAIWAAVVFLRQPGEPPVRTGPTQPDARVPRPPARSGTTPMLRTDLLRVARAPYPADVQNIFSAPPPPPVKSAEPSALATAPSLPPPDPFQEEAKQFRYVGFLRSGSANTAVLIFLFLPARDAQSQLEGRIRELERNVRNLQRDGRTSDALLTAMREAEEFSQGFPRRTDLVGLMGRLTKLANSLALKVPDTDYQPSEMKGVGLTKVTVQMGVEGPYEKIRRFVYELESMRRFLVIERLSLRDLKAASVLQVQVQLAMYLR